MLGGNGSKYDGADIWSIYASPLCYIIVLVVGGRLSCVDVSRSPGRLFVSLSK
jgi:hypothetical protein